MHIGEGSVPRRIRCRVQLRWWSIVRLGMRRNILRRSILRRLGEVIRWLGEIMRLRNEVLLSRRRGRRCKVLRWRDEVLPMMRNMLRWWNEVFLYPRRISLKRYIRLRLRGNVMMQRNILRQASRLWMLRVGHLRRRGVGCLSLSLCRNVWLVAVVDWLGCLEPQRRRCPSTRTTDTLHRRWNLVLIKHNIRKTKRRHVYKDTHGSFTWLLPAYLGPLMEDRRSATRCLSAANSAPRIDRRRVHVMSLPE